MTSRAPRYTKPFTFVTINLDSQEEANELLRQRTICGWANTKANIDYWHRLQRDGAKDFWWITVPKSETVNAADHIATYTETESSVTQSSEGPDATVRVGHIALDHARDPPDLELANPDGSVKALGTFFILPEHRSAGLGRACVAEVEARALQYPECRALGLDAISRKYAEDDGPDWGGRLEAAGFPRLKGRSNEDWYARMGFVTFKEKPLYEPIDGRPDLLVASFMKKQLR